MWNWKLDEIKINNELLLVIWLRNNIISIKFQFNVVETKRVATKYWGSFKIRSSGIMWVLMERCFRPKVNCIVIKQ